MKQKKGAKARKKHPRRKHPKPRGKGVRGSASGGRKSLTNRKRKMVKKTIKKTLKKKKTHKKRVGGRAGGVIPKLRKQYNRVKESVGKFYDENKRAIDAAATIGGLGALGYGVYRLTDPHVRAEIRDIAGRLDAEVNHKLFENVAKPLWRRWEKERQNYKNTPEYWQKFYS